MTRDYKFTSANVIGGEFKVEGSSDNLTWHDITKAISEIGPIPAPAKILARPEFVELLRSKIPHAEDPMSPMLGGVSIKEVKNLPVRWLYSYDGKTVFESIDGEVLASDTPPVSFEIPMPGHPRIWPPPPDASPYFWAGYAQGLGWECEQPPKPRRRKRRSKGWRKHVRRVKAADRRGV